MKKLVAQKGVKVPKHKAIDKKRITDDREAYKKELIKEIGLPMFFKQITGTSGTGSCKAGNEQELDEAFNVCLEYKEEYEVDEFVDASMLSIEYMFVRDQMVFFKVTMYSFPHRETLNGKPYGTWNLQPTDPLYKRLFKLAYKVEEAM